MKRKIFFAAYFVGALPISAWILSLIFHLVRFGEVFVFNEMAYMPLLVVCGPVIEVGLLKTPESHVGFFILSCKAALVYFALLLVALSPIYFGRKLKIGRTSQAKSPGQAE